ncbi:Dipeptide chemoreceptor protein [Marinibacterium anthonyi]|nr:Dipeptide chemoreceptor protein [Marinibacterium anthonyi]
MSQADTFQDAAQAGGSGLDTLRRTASQIFAVTLVVMGILVSVLASFWSPDWPLIAGASAILAGTAVYYALKCPEALPARLAITVALAFNWALVTYVSTGFGDGEFVLDGHMLFFTYSALLLSYVCWRAVLTLATIVVLHHLVFNIIAPTLVWPSANYGWYHLVIHGVLASAVAGTGMSMAVRVSDLFSTSEASLKKAEAQTALVERAQRDRVAMMDLLDSEFGKVVGDATRGRFDTRITARFDDDTLTHLRDGLNDMVTMIERGVGETRRVIEKVAEGDLSDRMEGQFAGDFDALKTGVNATIERLSVIVQDIKERNGDLDHQAKALSQSSQHLAAQAEEQAAALEETATSMDQVSQTVKASARHASDSGVIVDRTLTDVEGIVTTVRASMHAVAEIDESAREIERIINVIEDIARETNLLALNAAVEAARAGEAGKGFAIVANEVRDLAIRAGQASNDVRSVIDESQQKVTRGVELVNSAETALGDIVERVGNIASHVHQIVQDSSGQDTAIAQIRDTVASIDHITQENARTAERTARSVTELENQSQGMLRAISVFKLVRNEKAAAAHRAA